MFYHVIFRVHIRIHAYIHTHTHTFILCMQEMNFEVPKYGHGPSVPWEPKKNYLDKTDEEKKALAKMVCMYFCMYFIVCVCVRL